MTRAKGILAVIAVIAGSVFLMPGQASANPDVWSNFTCDVTFASWPGSGSAVCDGMVTGVGTSGGPTVACTLNCSFTLTINNYNETCLGGGIPPVGSYEGDVIVSDLDRGSYDATRVGTHVYFNYPDFAGEAVFIPHVPPQPTCANPGPMTATLDGRLYGVAPLPSDN